MLVGAVYSHKTAEGTRKILCSKLFLVDEQHSINKSSSSAPKDSDAGFGPIELLILIAISFSLSTKGFGGSRVAQASFTESSHFLRGLARSLIFHHSKAQSMNPVRSLPHLSSWIWHVDYAD